MARKSLFEYAVLHNPKPTRDAMGNDTTPDTEVITSITEILATSEKEVTMLAARGIPEKFLKKLDDIEIIVRPL
jgi:hypothetical protein